MHRDGHISPWRKQRMSSVLTVRTHTALLFAESSGRSQANRLLRQMTPPRPERLSHLSAMITGKRAYLASRQSLQHRYPAD